MPKDLKLVSASELNKLYEREDKKLFKLRDELIAAGRGHEYDWKTEKMTDPLALKYNAQMEICQAIWRERNYRMDYHGTLQPVGPPKNL